MESATDVADPRRHHPAPSATPEPRRDAPVPPASGVASDGGLPSRKSIVRVEETVPKLNDLMRGHIGLVVWNTRKTNAITGTVAMWPVENGVVSYGANGKFRER